MKLNDKIMKYLKAAEKFNDQNYDLYVMPVCNRLVTIITKKDTEISVMVECFYDKLKARSEEECIKYYIKIFNAVKDLMEDYL